MKAGRLGEGEQGGSKSGRGEHVSKQKPVLWVTQLLQALSSQILFMGKPPKSLEIQQAAFFPLWNRLHPWVVCQSPKAYSDSAPVLNLMLCLAHGTRGHSKARLGLRKIKSGVHRRKWKGVMRSVFQPWLPWRSFWAWKNSGFPFARLMCPQQQG